MIKFVEIIDGKVWAVREAEELPKLPPPTVLKVLNTGDKVPQVGETWDGETFGSPVVRLRYKRDHIRNKLSVLSQAKFDKMRSLVDSPNLLSLVPQADNEVPNAAGLTFRDLLRTFARRWEENSTIHNDDPNFVSAMGLLATLNIVTPEERDAVVTGS